MKTNGWKFWTGLFLIVSPMLSDSNTQLTGDPAYDFGQSISPILMVAVGIYLWYKNYKDEGSKA